MQKYIVYTHLGPVETMAKTPARALQNVRWRLFGRSVAAFRYIDGWSVVAAV